MPMKLLTIALLGNTNNYPLLLAEGFIKLGHHVRLLVNRKELIHRPESKHPGWKEKYPPWIYDYSGIDDIGVAYETPAIDELITQLTHGVDLAILNDIGPSFARYLHCPHVVFLTGSDLTYYADYGSIERRTAQWDPEFRRSAAGRRILTKLSELVIHQRDGILSADVASFAFPKLSNDGDLMLDAIGVTDSRRMMIHLSDTETLNALPVPENRNLRILNGSRILWRQTTDNRYIDMDLKGTDILLKGFALYCHKGGNAELRLFRKGEDVDKAIELIDDLGIADKIIWLDEISLSRFYEEMTSADIICDQFSKSFPGMVTSDAYALGRPVLANFRNEVFSRHYSEPLPGLQAASPEEVCDQLFRAENGREMLKFLGEQSRRFAVTYLSPVRMAEMILNKVNVGSCVSD
jgi:glycosyltransferase involved in cell wall biosynthesis